MERHLSSIDHVPSENGPAFAQQVREWIRTNAGAVLKENHGSRNLDDYDGGHLHLELGGYVADPYREGKQANVEASFSIGSRLEGRLEDVIDPEGTVWHRHTCHADANWPSYGSQGSRMARLRANIVDVVTSLAERFDAELGTTVVWTKGTTKAERDRIALNHRTDATRLVVAASIKEAIHTTCRGMRVLDDRTVDAPELVSGIVTGDYDVVIEKKEYRASVYVPQGGPHEGVPRMNFRRTK